MKFQEIQHHIEHYGCSLDHYLEDAYMATNCVNAEMCLIEKLPKYSIDTLCHYFAELKIPAPDFMKADLASYIEVRENVEATIESGKVKPLV